MSKLPEHLFVADGGDLYDTRKPDWSKNPVRKGYQSTFSSINNTAQLRATLRNGGHAWPGGYPMYFITSDGAALSFEAVRENYRSVSYSIRANCDDGWRVVACDVNWEDSHLYCDHSGEHIEPAYDSDIEGEQSE